MWEFNYACKTNVFRTYFADTTDPENPTLAGVEIIDSNGKERWINYKMMGIENPELTTRVEGSRFVFENIRDKVDLEYTIERGKLKENIIIKEPLVDLKAIKEANAFTLNTDNASLASVYFEYTYLMPKIKIRSGSNWVTPKSIRHRSGTNWVSAKAIHVRDGSSWKRIY